MVNRLTCLTRLIPTRLTRLTRLTCLFGREVKLDFFILIFEEQKNPKLNGRRTYPWSCAGCLEIN